MKKTAKNWRVGQYVKNVKTGTIAKIWNVDFDTGRMQLEDLHGNKERKYFPATDWIAVDKPNNKPFEIYKGWIIEEDFHPKMEEVAWTAKKGDNWLNTNDQTDKPILVSESEKGYWLTKEYLKQAVDYVNSDLKSKTNSKSGAKGFMATRLKMAERGDFKTYTPIEVLIEAQKFQTARSKSGAARDEKTNSKNRLSPTPENLVRWMRDPGRFDLIGIDTDLKTPTADLKIRKEIFWSRLLKK